MSDGTNKMNFDIASNDHSAVVMINPATGTSAAVDAGTTGGVWGACFYIPQSVNWLCDCDECKQHRTSGRF